MQKLTTMHCEACDENAPPATEAEITTFTPQIPRWDLTEYGGVKQLACVYQFKDFMDALNFTNRVGHLAETESHHPAILIEWGAVTVRWWTHKIHGLHRNDFIMAAKTDQLYKVGN